MIHSLYKKAGTALMGLFLCVGLYSCNNVLDLKPQDSVYDQVYWKRESDATSALMGTYSLLRKSLLHDNYVWGGGAPMAHFAYADLTTGIFTQTGYYPFDFLVKGDTYYGKGIQIDDFTGDYLDDLQNWTSFYKTINQANVVIEKVNKMPDGAFKDPATKKKIVGEALFLRAYNYFYMTRIWGNVPLVNTYNPDPVSSTNIPRTNEVTVLDSCTNDLKRALSLLTWNSGSDKAVRADKGAVYALQAHIYRWKYFLTEQKNNDPSLLTKAVACIDAITQSGQYSLVHSSQFSQLFKGRSPEGIFEINTAADQNEAQVDAGFYVQTLTLPEPSYYHSSYLLNTPVINDLFDGDESDARFIYNFDKINDDKLALTKYSGKSGENLVYTDEKNKTGLKVNCNITIFRLAEMLLLRAECNAILGNTGPATTDLNTVRRRALINDFAGGDLKSEIVRETCRELFCEGHTFYDLVRNRELASFIEDDRFPLERFEQEGWKWPIARSLFTNNPGLIQNKYWIGVLR